MSDDPDHTMHGDFARYDPTRTPHTPPLKVVPADNQPARGWYMRFRNERLDRTLQPPNQQKETR